MSELRGPLAERVLELQRRFDPRMARELPPHVTIAGSSGMGPIHPSTTDDQVRDALKLVADATPPITVVLQPPMQFMQSNVVVMQVDPNGAIRALHERIKSSGLSYEAARFTFTPHLTLARHCRGPYPAGAAGPFDWDVDTVALMQSQTRTEGVRYRRLETWPIGA